MALTEHIGYGKFSLECFRPGDMFACFDGSLGRVCDPQPALGEFIQVWVDYGTSNARKELLHRTAMAHAVSCEQAECIERRQRRPKGGAS